MELILVLVAVTAVAALIYFNRTAKNFDINQDGKVDAADAVAAVTNTVEGVTTTVKKAAVRAKTPARSAAKRPAAKKAAAKKPAAKKK